MVKCLVGMIKYLDLIVIHIMRSLSKISVLTIDNYIYSPFHNYTWINNLFCIFFYSVLRPFQEYFSSYETGQSVDGAKMGEPREKQPGTPASRTWLVLHVPSVGLKPTPDIVVR